MGLGGPKAAARWRDGKLADKEDLAIIDKVFRQQHGAASGCILGSSRPGLGEWQPG